MNYLYEYMFDYCHEITTTQPLLEDFKMFLGIFFLWNSVVKQDALNVWPSKYFWNHHTYLLLILDKSPYQSYA